MARSDERAAVLLGKMIRLGGNYIRIREALAAQGLHVVTAAQMRVLEAMAKAPDSTVALWAGSAEDTSWVSELGWAELARREGK